MKKLTSLALLLLIAGCSTNHFQYIPETDVTPITQAERIPLHLGEVDVEIAKAEPVDHFFFNVEGKGNYEPVFKKAFAEALQESLDESTLFGGTKESAILKATVLQFSQLSVGLQFPTTMVVRYQLVDEKSGKVLFDQEITSTEKVPVTTAYLGTTRAVDARNLAVQQNITQLLKALKVSRIH